MGIDAVVLFEIVLIIGSVLTFALWELRERRSVRRNRRY